MTCLTALPKFLVCMHQKKQPHEGAERTSDDVLDNETTEVVPFNFPLGMNFKVPFNVTLSIGLFSFPWLLSYNEESMELPFGACELFECTQFLSLASATSN